MSPVKGTGRPGRPRQSRCDVTEAARRKRRAETAAYKLALGRFQTEPTNCNMTAFMKAADTDYGRKQLPELGQFTSHPTEDAQVVEALATILEDMHAPRERAETSDSGGSNFPPPQARSKFRQQIVGLVASRANLTNEYVASNLRINTKYVKRAVRNLQASNGVYVHCLYYIATLITSHIHTLLTTLVPITTLTHNPLTLQLTVKPMSSSPRSTPEA
jgi:hypothetical protein